MLSRYFHLTARRHEGNPTCSLEKYSLEQAKAVREFHSADDFAAIGRWLHGSKNYYIQNFTDSGNLIGSGMCGFQPEELQIFADSLLKDFEFVGIRGV